MQTQVPQQMQTAAGTATDMDSTKQPLFTTWWQWTSSELYST